MRTERQNAHESLFSGTPLKLGLAHWYLLRGAIEIEKRRSDKTGRKYESTEFGTEGGGDEINWWIHRKESAITELHNRTADTLSHAQQLKDDATALKTASPSTYAELISTLKAFADAHATQITNLYEYVVWLHTKDILCPSILFTYRVWGSTRRSERWVELSADSPDTENPMAMKKIMEMVFGLRGLVLYRIDSVELDILGDLATTIDPEDPAYSETLTVPESVLLARTTHETFDGLLEYFKMIRDSLRNVLLDIEKRLEPERLLKSDVFWRKFVVKAKGSKKSEERLLERLSKNTSNTLEQS